MFFSKLRFILPYKPVRDLYYQYYNDSPINNYLTSRADVIEWFYNIHYKIIIIINKNKNNNNKLPIPSYKKICQKYESFRANCATKTDTNSCRIPIKGSH